MIFISETSFQGPKQDFSGDASRIVPINRWDADIGWHEWSSLNKRFGSFLEKPEHFDAAFFKVSDVEANAMDAQQRLVLEGSWNVLSKFYLPTKSSDSALTSTSVAVGVSYNEYYLNMSNQEMTAFTATSGTLSVVCGRVSFTFGLKGPSVSIDTACSSSLVAVHLSSTSFVSAGYSRAVVAGVNLTIRAETTSVLSKAGVLTADGRCKTIDKSADGYARGEACIVHLLESSEVDENAGVMEMEQRMAIVGSAVNQDGRSSSLTAPNGPSQQTVIRKALCFSDDDAVNPGHVAKLELHGTGTSLGDPIEIGAALAVLDSERYSIFPLSLQAIKSQLLHSEPAAGAVGLASMARRLRQDDCQRMLHLRTINPHVIGLFQNHALRTETRGWHLQRQEGPAACLNKESCIGSVSSFAYQGTNAHTIIQINTKKSISSLKLDRRHAWEKSRHWFTDTSHPFLERYHSLQTMVFLL